MPDPNFPPNLDIKPLALDPATTAEDTWLQNEAIQKYGIAGRIWEATELMIQYFTPESDSEPPCSLLQPRGSSNPRRIIELGSGQSVASLHLAQHLKRDDILVLTDLPEVIPLCEQSLASKRSSISICATAKCEPLGWGSPSEHLKQYRPFTHILMCDLIYFPELYPALLYSLLDLTEPETANQDETFGPEVIMAYKPRTLALEHSFFDAFSSYFRMTPVVGGIGGGGESEVKLYLCQRWQITEEWRMPSIDTVMNGAPGVVRGRDFGYIDQMFASMEW